MIANRTLPFATAILLLGEFTTPAIAWDAYGHMAVAYVAYQHLTPEAQKRANDLLKLNPRFNGWSESVPADASPAEKNLMVFMLAATWPDEIKSDRSYKSDGSQNGNRPEGSPNATANEGYQDKSRHKYWHFVDTPFAEDGTALPPIPTPNAQERISLFRGVLASISDDKLKSYDLVWLLHLVGDVHQPLHCATRVDNQDPSGDNGGNFVKLNCTGCPSELHALWDDLLGIGANTNIAKAVIKAAKKLPPVDPTLAAKSDEKEWIAESFQAAKQTVYQPPIRDGEGPFVLSGAYQRKAKGLAQERVSLAGVRLGNLINAELK